jgi:hypothetical protein
MSLNYAPMPTEETDNPKLIEANVKFHQLTDRQQLFIIYYLGEAGFVATEAYKLAGYKSHDPKKTDKENRRLTSIKACMIKNNPRVKSVIDAFFDTEMMAAKEHAYHLATIARNLPQGPAFFLEPQTVQEFNKEGDAIEVERYRLDWAKVKEYGSLIKSIKFDAYGQPILEFHDRMRALDMIGRQHLDLGKDNLNIKNTFQQNNTQNNLIILPPKDDGGTVPNQDEEEENQPRIVDSELNGKHRSNT